MATDDREGREGASRLVYTSFRALSADVMESYGVAHIDANLKALFGAWLPTTAHACALMFTVLGLVPILDL